MFIKYCLDCSFFFYQAPCADRNVLDYTDLLQSSGRPPVSRNQLSLRLCLHSICIGWIRKRFSWSEINSSSPLSPVYRRPRVYKSTKIVSSSDSRLILDKISIFIFPTICETPETAAAEPFRSGSESFPQEVRIRSALHEKMNLVHQLPTQFDVLMFKW